MQVGELFVRLGFKVNTKDLREFNTGMRETLNTALQLAGVTASVAGFNSLLNGAAKGAVALENLSFKYQVATKSVQGFSNALLLANPNMSRDAALAATSNINQFAQMMPINGVGKFAQFGGTTADNTPEKIRDRIAKNYDRVVSLFGPSWANEAIREITGTDEALNGMLMTVEEFQEASKKGIISEEDTRNLREYAATVQELSNNFNELKARWLAVPAKEMSGFIKDVNEKGFIQAYGDKLWGGIKSISNAAHRRGEEDKYYRDLKKDLMQNSGKTSQQAEDIIHAMRTQKPAATPQEPGGTSAIQGSARSYFESMGWSPAQAAGIVQRLAQESYPHLDPNAVGDGGKAYGVAQWHRDRQLDFEKWAGKSIMGSSREEQLAFVNYELTKGKERAAGNMLRKAQSQQDAHRIFTNEYERPAAENRVTKIDQHIYSTGDAQHTANMVKSSLQQTNMGSAY